VRVFGDNASESNNSNNSENHGDSAHRCAKEVSEFLTSRLVVKNQRCLLCHKWSLDNLCNLGKAAVDNDGMARR
jgi:hypothetical protein